MVLSFLETDTLYSPGWPETYMWCTCVCIYICIGVCMHVEVRGQSWIASSIILHHFQAQGLSFTLKLADSARLAVQWSSRNPLISISSVPELQMPMDSSPLATFVLRIFSSYFSTVVIKYHDPTQPTEPSPQPYVLWFPSQQFLRHQFYYCSHCVALFTSFELSASFYNFLILYWICTFLKSLSCFNPVVFWMHNVPHCYALPPWM